MAVGPLLLVVLAMKIAARSSWTLGLPDAVFWLTVIATATVRYLDITRLDGETAHGRTASTRDFKSYAAGLAGGAGALWALVQSVHV